MARAAESRGLLAVIMALLVALATAQAQQPRPFPQPSPPKPTAPAPPATTPAQPVPPSSNAATSPAPDEAKLGVAIYPGAQFLTSYDAGRGQRFYLFGVTLSFGQAVTYYQNILKTRGDVLFETPPTHQFEIGRFEDETMAFPPTVTIKDYTWGGSAGYPNPLPGAEPARFPTVIQIVPVPAGAAR